jgi:hypothetical protein
LLRPVLLQFPLVGLPKFHRYSRSWKGLVGAAVAVVPVASKKTAKGATPEVRLAARAEVIDPDATGTPQSGEVGEPAPGATNEIAAGSGGADPDVEPDVPPLPVESSILPGASPPPPQPNRPTMMKTIAQRNSHELPNSVVLLIDMSEPQKLDIHSPAGGLEFIAGQRPLRMLLCCRHYCPYRCGPQSARR